MDHRRISELMTRDVVSVRTDPPVEEIVHDVLTTTLGFAPSDVAVEASEGQVLVRGTVDDSGPAPVLTGQWTSVDGAVSVSERLSYRTDPDRAGNGAMP
ncbi:hypothetical protein OG760_30475 [Streptomyces sp. NBC_00963]|uniref:hypothetical protein n=1 Tax=Streptomyces sp. NBC_00963 TaxID=2903697 RepID=UPI003867B118|nr:hypothetical protein OG760_30475 [Streptomyces sp. NBC_00963]